MRERWNLSSLHNDVDEASVNNFFEQATNIKFVTYLNILH